MIVFFAFFMKFKEYFLLVFKKIGEFWNFIWNDNSFYANLLLIIFLFVFVKFILYPFIGIVLGTQYPIVSVVSGSMEHKAVYEPYVDGYVICGKIFNEPFYADFDTFWNICGSWYENKYNITKNEFEKFPFKDGFDKGDVMLLTGYGDINVGDVIVFMTDNNVPIIHRVVNVKKTSYGTFYTTKGDHNPDSINSFSLNEINIPEDRVIGKAFFRIPKVGYVKIWFSEIFKR